MRNRLVTLSLLLACLLTTAGISPAFGADKKQEKKNSEDKAQASTEKKPDEPPAAAEAKKPGGEKPEPSGKELLFDMTEVPPVITHHQITIDGKLLKYTATTGRLPIKRLDGKTEAQMFFVAYTLDGQESNRRPVTFAFNGGPGSASIWLHMGALGPKRVVLQPDGFMPAAPYRAEDNPYTLLDKSDVVMVDAIGTGFSRPANDEAAKKFWGVKGDIEAFSEFIRLYITRNERWSSPLYLLGESYGTTRAAGVAGELSQHGISFNGIMLVSVAMTFQTLENTKANDQPYPLLIPTYTMIAGYHKKLAPELMQDMNKTRKEAEQWASTEYTTALAKGDAMTPDERARAIDQMARYTGLDKRLLDNANLRIDVPKFTHNLLLDQKLRVGRLDGRYSGPDPDGLLDTPFYDPAGAATLPPYTSVFNNYVRTELGYKTDMPYRVFIYDDPEFQKWDWGSGAQGFPDTATALRRAIVVNPYLKVLVLEGLYDLATPYYAADFTVDHLDLSPNYRKNISVTTYPAGHMMYVEAQSREKMKHDLADFIEKSMPK
jgi:carboxypeptidase C (cathepsin A)